MSYVRMYVIMRAQTNVNISTIQEEKRAAVGPFLFRHEKADKLVCAAETRRYGSTLYLTRAHTHSGHCTHSTTKRTGLFFVRKKIK